MAMTDFFKRKRRRIVSVVIIALSYIVWTHTRIDQLQPLWPSEADRLWILNTPGCSIPAIDPYDVEVRHLVNKEVIKVKCSSERSSLVTFVDGPFLQINRNASIMIDYCEYQTISRSENPKIFPDQGFSYGSPIRFASTVEPEVDFVRVSCYRQAAAAVENVYTNFHMFMKRKKDVEERCKAKLTKFALSENSKEMFNVLMIGLDSMSRLNTIRQMKKTRRFLINELSAVEFKGYNKVGLNTFPNLIPLTAGLSISELAKVVGHTGPYDNASFVWNEFSSRGYRTLYSEDASRWGMFTMGLNGFIRAPTDYYRHPFSLALDEYEIQGYKDCTMNNKLEIENVLDWIYDFERTFQRDPHFAFFHTARYTHDYVNEAATIDESVFQFFQRLKQEQLLNNTVLIVFGDHGFRFGKMRQTYVGKMEDYLPLLHIVIPPRFRSQYPKLVEALYGNADRLITHFDVHQTLRHLMNFPGQMLGSTTSADQTRIQYSLFTPVPAERTCSMAGIPSSFCACRARTRLNVLDPTVRLMSQLIVDHINDLLSIHRGKCAQLVLHNVSEAQSFIASRQKDIVQFDPFHYFRSSSSDLASSNRSYQITLQTTPGHAIFEVTATYGGKLPPKRFHSRNQMDKVAGLANGRGLNNVTDTSEAIDGGKEAELPGGELQNTEFLQIEDAIEGRQLLKVYGISRLNRYDNQSACVANNREHKTMCFCVYDTK